MDNKQITLPSTLESVDRAEELAVSEAEHFGLDEDERQQFGMAVRECMVNAVVHGNGYSSNKVVHFAVDRSTDELVITIGDEGAGFDPESLPDPLAPENLLRPSGRGLLLIRAFVDEFDLHRRAGGGTEVRMVKHHAKS